MQNYYMGHSYIIRNFVYFFYKKISNFINKNHFRTYNTPSKSYSKSSNHTLASSKSMFIYVLGNKIMIDLNADCKADFFYFFFYFTNIIIWSFEQFLTTANAHELNDCLFLWGFIVTHLMTRSHRQLYIKGKYSKGESTNKRKA